MTVTLQPSPLRLPVGELTPAAAQAADGLRACLETLSQRRFSGRVSFQRGDDLAEVLLRTGQPLAATLSGGGERPVCTGQEALNTLTALPGSDWVYQIEPLEPSLLGALAGLGAEPEVCSLSTVAGLRALLRDLAQRGENGVLELRGDRPEHERWARALLSEGRLLGSYSDAAPRLTPSLEPLGGLLCQPLPPVHWFRATSAALQIPPAVAMVQGLGGAIERQVIWIVSRFEGDWGRARERSAPASSLEEALARMLACLRTLAGVLERNAAHAQVLEVALANPIEAEPRPAAELDAGLAGLPPARTCPVLGQLAADALQRIVLAFPEPNLTECCRQAALALQAELRAAFPPPPGAPTVGGTTR